MQSVTTTNFLLIFVLFVSLSFWSSNSSVFLPAMPADRLWSPSASVPRPVPPLQPGEPCGSDYRRLFPSWRPSSSRFPGHFFRGKFPKPSVLPLLGPTAPKQGAGLQDRVQPHIHLLTPQCKPGEPCRHRPPPLPVRRRLLSGRVLPQLHQRPGAAGRCRPGLYVSLWRASLWCRVSR